MTEKSKSKKMITLIIVLLVGIAMGVFVTLAYKQPVTIVMPEYCFGYDVSDSVIETYKQQGLIESGTINQDKSVTMKMSRTQHRNMLKSISDSAEAMLLQIPYQSVTSNILRIEHNDDFTEYEIVFMDGAYKAEDTKILSTLTYIQAVYGSVMGDNKENLTINFLGEGEKEPFGVFTLSHIGTDQETEFEKKFMETYKAEMIPQEEDISKTEDPRELDPNEPTNEIIQQEIDKAGMDTKN